MAELDKPTEELHIAAQESIRIKMNSIVAPLLALNALVDGLPIASMPSQEDLWTQDAILDRLSERDQGQGEAVGVRSHPVLLLLLLQLGGQEGGGGGDEGVREQDLHQVHPQKL